MFFKPKATLFLLRSLGPRILIRPAAVLVLACLVIGCAATGHIQDEYPEEFYQVPKLLDETKAQAENPTFLVYGDNKVGWRVDEKFFKKKNWATWKMVLVPFYQLYLVGNGIVGGINKCRHAHDYGQTERLMVRDAISSEALRSKPDFIMNLGDITADDGRRPKHWALFLKEYKADSPLLDEIPYLPVAGNHERTNDRDFGRPNYEAIFDYPLFYVVNFPDLELFVIDSNIIIDQKQDIDDDLQEELFGRWFVSDGASGEPAWLERELQKRKDVFKIVALHHPLISYGFHRSDWEDSSYGLNLVDKKIKLLDLFRKSGVQVVFSAHDHIYQHIILEDIRVENGGLAEAGYPDVHQIVSAGGGVPLRESPSDDEITRYTADYVEQGLYCRPIIMESEYHYSCVTIEAARMTIETFAVTRDPARPVRLLDRLVLDK